MLGQLKIVNISSTRNFSPHAPAFGSANDRHFVIPDLAIRRASRGPETVLIDSKVGSPTACPVCTS